MGIMRKILKIARREYAETVRTKTFIIGLLVAPLLIGIVMFISVRSAVNNATGVTSTCLSGRLLRST